MTEENPYEFPDPMPDWVCPTCGAEWFDEGNGRHSTHSFLRNILTRHMMSASQERCWMCADTGATVRDRIAFMLEKPERATTFICQFYGVYVDGLVGDMERIEAALNLMADDEDGEMISELTEDISLNYEDEFTEFCLDRR